MSDDNGVGFFSQGTWFIGLRNGAVKIPKLPTGTETNVCQKDKLLGIYELQKTTGRRKG